jgi:hypothetical protein
MENVCWVCDTPIDSAKSEKERVKDDESKRDPRIVEQESLERKRKRKNK